MWWYFYLLSHCRLLNSGFSSSHFIDNLFINNVILCSPCSDYLLVNIFILWFFLFSLKHYELFNSHSRVSCIHYLNVNLLVHIFIFSASHYLIASQLACTPILLAPIISPPTDLLILYFSRRLLIECKNGGNVTHSILPLCRKRVNASCPISLCLWWCASTHTLYYLLSAPVCNNQYAWFIYDLHVVLIFLQRLPIMLSSNSIYKI